MTLFGSVYPVRGLVSLICSTVFFFSLSGGQTSRDINIVADFVNIHRFVCINRYWSKISNFNIKKVVKSATSLAIL